MSVIRRLRTFRINVAAIAKSVLARTALWDSLTADGIIHHFREAGARTPESALRCCRCLTTRITRQ